MNVKPAKESPVRKAVMHWVMTAGYMGVLFFLSSREKFGFVLPEDSDKIIHALAYMPLGLLLYVSLRASGLKRYAFVTASFLACLYGVSDEIHQFFVPGRVASYGDVLADAVGALAGGLAGVLLKK